MNENTINDAAAALVKALAGNQTLDVAAVEKIAGDVCTRKVQALAGALMPAVEKAAVAAAEKVGGVRRVKVAPVSDRPAVDLGVQHWAFERLWQLCNVRGMNGNRLNVYLYGPAGTGKTTAAEAVARGLYGDAWRDHFHANGAISAPYDLLGFIDAGGVYHETEFFKAFKNGGVYLFDELDSSSPAAVLAFNQALANGCCAFPCGMVQRSPDCVIIAGGNTCMRGDGAGSGFQRVRMDSAFRDRFVFLEWGIDEKLEAAIAGGYGDAGQDWCAKVQTMRKNAAAVGVRDFEITPRATFNGCAMIAAGCDLADVVASCVRKGLNDEAWSKVSRGVL